MKLIEKLYLDKQGATVAYKITLKTGKKLPNSYPKII